MRLGLRQIGLHPHALLAMQTYDWPGNVRELEHLLMRASLKTTRNQQSRPLILAEHLDLPVMELPADNPELIANQATSATCRVIETGLREAVDAFQKSLILQILQENGRNWSAAARQLKTDRANLNRLAIRLGIKD